jgi:uncharacterized protein (DUF58 family)
VSGRPPRPTAVQWTPRAYLFLGAGAALLVFGVLLRSAVPVFVGLPLLVAPFAAPWSVPRELGRTDLAWEETGSGSAVSVTGTLRGRFGGGERDLALTFSLPTSFRELEPTRFDYTPAEVRFSASWHILEPTIVTVPSPLVEWCDPLGLSRRELAGARPDLRLERYPLGLRGLGAIRLDRTIPLPGESRSRRVGSSGEFFGIRTAVPGEPLRQINWRATLRVGRFLANDYELDRAGDLVVLVDVRPTGLGHELDERLLGLAKAAAYGVADSFLRGKIRIGFASFGEFVEAVPLSTGRVHRVRLLRAINDVRLAEGPGPASRCAYGLRRYFRPGVTTLVISSWAGEPTGDLLPYLRRQGYPSIMLSPSTVPLGEGVYALHPVEERIAVAIERLERRRKLAHLWSYGPVIDWEEFWSLASLVHTMRQPAGRRHG